MSEKKYTDATFGLIDFIEKSPSPFHVIDNIKKELDEKGFIGLSEGKEWNISGGGDYYVIRNMSSLIAFRVPERAPSSFMMVASHSDSPSFKLKPNFDTECEGCYVKLNTEPYGSMIYSTWLDRPLGVAGRAIVETENGIKTVLVDIGRDYCVIPNVAIHMNRDVNSGKKYDSQKDMLPLIGDISAKGRLLSEISEAHGCKEEEILGLDLNLYVREKGKVFGASGEYFSAPRIDDLQCVYSSKEAFLSEKNGDAVTVLAVFDNEEVGSTTKQGARSTFLSDTLERVCRSLGETLARLLPSSMMLSADNGHAVHPNMGEVADITNRPKMNGGVLIKYNAAEKYTTDGVSDAIIRKILKTSDVPYQEYVNRSNIPGGSTLGNLSNEKISLNTADVGAAQLAMHSAYETAGCEDTFHLIRCFSAFYKAVIGDADVGAYWVK